MREKEVLGDEEPIVLPIPALVAVLLERKTEKGAPLTGAEVSMLRDGAECVMSPPDVVEQVARTQGYHDVMPDHVWEDWQAIRPTLHAETGRRSS